jgi:hypothetical protein
MIGLLVLFLSQAFYLSTTLPSIKQRIAGRMRILSLSTKNLALSTLILANRVSSTLPQGSEIAIKEKLKKWSLQTIFEEQTNILSSIWLTKFVIHLQVHIHDGTTPEVRVKKVNHTPIL